MPGKLNGVMTADDADRLPDHQLVDARRDVLEVAAHHQRWDAGRDLDVLDAALQFAFRLGERLAAFLRDHPGDLAEVRIEQRLEPEERLDAIAGRRTAPGLQRLRCGIDGLGDIGGARQRRFGQHISSRWIPNGNRLRLPRRLPVPVHEILQQRFLPDHCLLLEKGSGAN